MERGNSSGFTIMEVLMSVVLFTIMIAIALTALTGSFSLSRNSSTQAQNTMEAQRLIEEIRGQWSSISGQGGFNAGCLQMSAPTGVTLEFQDLTLDGALSGSTFAPVYSTNCSGLGARSVIPPIRRVTVRLGNLAAGSAPQTGSQLTIEVAKP